MFFRILGPLEVTDGESVVPIGGAKQRALLALLLLHANEVVSSDRLIDALWGPRSPDSGRTALNVRVSRLRKALGPTATKLLTRTPGYVLQIDRNSIDLQRFEQLVGEADTAEPAKAAVKLRSALELWRGPPLADLAYESFAQSPIRRLEELRLATVEKRIDADLALGRHGDLVAELETLVAEHPMRERLHAQLMLALYRCGRQADALEAYQRIRRKLAAELGLEPGPELGTLQTQILSHAPTLELPAAPDLPSPVSHALELPAALRVAGRSRFVGREAERSRLDDLARRAELGEHCQMLISGEPGIGKTRLTALFAEHMHARGTTVLFGQCHEGFAAPFQPWREALGQFVAGADARVLRAYVEDHGSELVRLTPRLARRVPELPALVPTDPDTERYLMFGAVLGLLETATADAPLLVVLDDLHWADAPSMALLEYVSASAPGGLVLIGTFRQTELSPSHPAADLLSDLGHSRATERITLEGLQEADIAELVNAGTKHELEETGRALAGLVQRQTNGNAFFVWEVLRHLAESGAIINDSHGRWLVAEPLASIELPASVRLVVSRRIERLGSNSADALATAAVIGSEFDLDLLARVEGIDEDTLLDLLERALATALLDEDPREPGRFRFAHAVIEQALYDGLSRTRRARLHRRVAEALEEHGEPEPGGRIEALAHHWSLTGRREDLPRAREYNRRAGERALDGLAPDAALAWFRGAADIHELMGDRDEAERCSILIGLGDAQRQVGDPKHRETLLEAAAIARALGDAERLALAALANHRAWASGSFGPPDPERTQALEAAAEALRDGDPALVARVHAAWGLEILFGAEFDVRRAVTAKAVALARRSGDPRTLAFALHAYCGCICAPETSSERLELAQEMTDAADRSGDPVTRFWSNHARGQALLENGDMNRAVCCFETCRELVHSIGQPFVRWGMLHIDAMLAVLAGGLEDAERLALEAYGIGVQHEIPDAAGLFGEVLSYIRRYQGRSMERVGLDQMAAIADGNPGIPAYAAGYGTALHDMGRDEEARRIVAAAAARRFTHVRRDFNWLILMAVFAELAIATESPESARVIYEQLEPWPHLIPTVGIATRPCVAHLLALLAAVLGRDDDAEQQFSAAAEIHRRLGSPVYEAQTLTAWAQTLVRLGRDPARVTSMLERAEALIAGRGIALIEGQIETVREAIDREMLRLRQREGPPERGGPSSIHPGPYGTAP